MSGVLFQMTAHLFLRFHLHLSSCCWWITAGLSRDLDWCWEGQNGRSSLPCAFSFVATWQGRLHTNTERDCTLKKSYGKATKPRLYLLPAHLSPQKQACYLLFKMSTASVYRPNNSLFIVSCVNLYPSVKHKICRVNKIVRMHKIEIWDWYLNVFREC